MTQQMPDVILVGDRKLPLFSTPLEMLWSDVRPRPNFVAPHTGLYRGYTALWRTRNESLWLLKLEGQVTRDESGSELQEIREFMQQPISRAFLPTRPFTRDDLFPGKKGPVLANWFTGQLGIPEGDFVSRESDFRSIFERELILSIERGLIIHKQMLETGADYRLEVAKRTAELARALPVTPDDKGWATCPHCGKRFWIFAKKSIEGSTHRYCGGRIEVQHS